MDRDQGHDELLGRSERINEPGFGRPAKGPLVERANRRMVSRRVAADVDHCHVASVNRPDVSFREQLVRPLDELNEDGRIGKGGLLAREIRLKDSPSP
jgi:hypothetical protein